MLCHNSLKCVLRLIICSKSLCHVNDPASLLAATGVQQSAGIAPNSESAQTLLTIHGEFDPGPLFFLPSFQQYQELGNVEEKFQLQLYFMVKKTCHKQKVSAV